MRSEENNDQVSGINVIKLYSPWQAAIGYALGGPLGVTYFIKKNYDNLRNKKNAKLTVIGGIIFFGALVYITFFTKDVTTLGFQLVAMVTAYNIVKTSQIKINKLDKSQYCFYSNWKVLGLSIIFFVVSIIILIFMDIIFTGTGLIEQSIFVTVET
jgi:hypothetical protein